MDYDAIALMHKTNPAILALLSDDMLAKQVSEHGLQTILARHTCVHRVYQLLAICEMVREGETEPAGKSL